MALEEGKQQYFHPWTIKRIDGSYPSYRLGQTAQTQFAFTSLTDFPHQVASIVLSPDHTVIITTTGAVYTFGQNRFDQLGYTLDTPLNLKSDDPIQSTPRRVVGPLKKEVVLGGTLLNYYSHIMLQR